MNINWKIRLQRKSFWLALVSLTVLLTQQLHITVFTENWADILNTILSIFVLIGVINDPTTSGLTDSERALSYEKPFVDKLDKKDEQ